MTANISAKNIGDMGRIVQFHRKLAGLSRMDLAEIAGTGKTVVYDIENGKYTVRLDTLLKVLEALNIKVTLDSPVMDRFRNSDDATR